MNIVLFEENELDGQKIHLNDHRHTHINQVLKTSIGGFIEIGKINGPIGQGVVVDRTETETIIEVKALQTPPPKPLPITLVIAMARPKMLKRILTSATMLGVKDFHLIHCTHVEKSYWQTPLLKDSNYLKYFLTGLEQAKDTQLPTLNLHRRFKPFIEDHAPEIIKNKTALVFHPYSENTFKRQNVKDSPTVCAIGPERGFTTYEIEQFTKAGFQEQRFGTRPLRTEVFTTGLLSQFIST